MPSRPSSGFNDGPGLRHRRHDDGRRQEAGGDREGRPGQARRGQEPAGRGLRRRQGRHRRRPDRVGRGAGDAAGGRGVQEDPAGRAGGGRLDHRRQVEQVHLPHRPQQHPGRDRQRRRARQAPAPCIATLAQDYAFGRDGVKAFKDAVKKAKIVHEEYLPADDHRLHRRRAAHHRQAEGPAGRKIGAGSSGPAAATRSRSPTWT